TSSIDTDTGDGANGPALAERDSSGTGRKPGPGAASGNATYVNTTRPASNRHDVECNSPAGSPAASPDTRRATSSGTAAPRSDRRTRYHSRPRPALSSTVSTTGPVAGDRKATMLAKCSSCQNLAKAELMQL